MIRLFLTLILLLTGVQLASSDAKFPTGPYRDEAEYFSERYKKTAYINSEMAVGLINAVELRIDDQVSNQCWTNSTAVQARISAELERTNIAVFTEPLAFSLPSSPILQIQLIGFRVGERQCIGYMKTSVFTFSPNQMGSLGYTGKVYMVDGQHFLWTKAALYSDAGTLNNVVMQGVQEHVDALVSSILKARRDEAVIDYRNNFPDSAPMTLKEMKQKIAQ